MKRPIVLLDCDGVLANFIERNLRELADAFGIVRDHDDVTDWRLEASLGLTEDQRHHMKAQWSLPGFAASMEPYRGAREGVDGLRAVADVYCVTAPMWSSPTWQHERTEWLGRYFGFERDQVVSTAAKHLVNGHVLVDDRVDVLGRWLSTHGSIGWGGQAVAWSHKYNESATWYGLRTNKWADVIGLAQEAARRLRGGARDPQDDCAVNRE